MAVGLESGGDAVERSGEPVAAAPPAPVGGKMKDCRASQHGRIECLEGDTKPRLRDDANDVIDRLGVQVACETLELRGQQYRVGSVDLLRGVPSAARRAAHQGMSGLDLIEFGRAVGSPLTVRSGGHAHALVVIGGVIANGSVTRCLKGFNHARQATS
jgi:hypothetical protein